jgi:hypothetical protein
MVLTLFLAGCSRPDWTATETAAVELACIAGSAQALGETVEEVREDFGPACADFAGSLEEAGCSPDEAADIVTALALVGADAARAMEEECS